MPATQRDDFSKAFEAEAKKYEETAAAHRNMVAAAKQ
jgi:hypothetical protein